MKKIWVYMLGVLTGIVFTVIVLFIIGNSNKQRLPDGVEFFDVAGEVMECSHYQVFQALGSGYALAWELSDSGIPNPLGSIVLLYDEDGSPYYDRQMVSATQGECFCQVGIYRYKQKSGDYATVPIVMIMEESTM